MGKALDRIGVRLGMSVAVLGWTLVSVGHVFASSAWGFALARAALGLGEGAAAPGGCVRSHKPYPPPTVREASRSPTAVVRPAQS